jgi:phosphomannomutase
MADAPFMLGVSGLRGIVGTSLTPDVATRFSAAFGSWLAARIQGTGKGAKPVTPLVIVGRDGRQGGDIFLDAAVTGLRAVGCDCRIAGVAMTPTIGFAVDSFGAAGGLVITASHNPQEWNGIKPVVRGVGLKPGTVSAGAPDKSSADEIIARFNSNQIAWRKAGAQGTCEWLDEPHETHVKHVLTTLGPADVKRIRAAKFKVTLDTVAGSGAAGAIALLEALGCKVAELYPANKHEDGIFPHAPEPLAENLGELRRAVKRDGSHLGFAQDPDADRLAIVDEKGNYVGEEYTLALAALSVLQSRPSASDKPTNGKSKSNGTNGHAHANGSVGGHVTPVLVANLSTSRMLDDIAAKLGARVLRTPVGEANVAQAMRQAAADGHDVILGGEGNGGVIWPKVSFIRDSLSAMGLVLAHLARTSQALSEAAAEIPTYSIVKRKVNLVKRDDVAPGLDRLARAFTNERIDRQDGLRVDVATKKAWLHVRPSNTEPIMRLIAEAPTRQIADTLLDQASRLIGVG